MRPLFNAVNNLSIVNGTVLIILGLTMVFTGKKTVFWTLLITLSILLTAILYELALNVLPKNNSTADAIVLSLVGLMTLTISIFASWCLVNLLEQVVPVLLGMILCVIFCNYFLLFGHYFLWPSEERAYMIGARFLSAFLGLLFGRYFRDALLCLAHAAFGAWTFIFGLIQYAGWPGENDKAIVIVYTAMASIWTVFGFIYQRCYLFVP